MPETVDAALVRTLVVADEALLLARFQRNRGERTESDVHEAEESRDAAFGELHRHVDGDEIDVFWTLFAAGFFYGALAYARRLVEHPVGLGVWDARFGLCSMLLQGKGEKADKAPTARTGYEEAIAHAEACHAEAREHVRKVHGRGFDARPELGLPADATVEQIQVASAERYGHVNDPERGPQTWAEYMWLCSRVEADASRTRARVLDLRLEAAGILPRRP